jgi:hypothetical protein
MKKLLLVLAIGSFAVACNNSGGEKAKTDTSAAPTADTSKPAAMDTTKKADTSKPAVADTTKK